MTATVPSPRVALVVDDDPDLALLCALHLQGVGYQVVEAYSGAQALELARSSAPTVVVLDRMLPDCDGFEVLAALRADDRTSLVPVVMASARAQDQDRIDALAAGVQDYVVKPFDAEDLVSAVDRAVETALLDRAGLDLSRLTGSGPAAPVPADARIAALEAELECLREADRARTEFLARLSHELRTPLTAVKGFGEWLALNWDRTPDDRKRELLQRMLDAGGRLDDMIGSLVEYSRLERGKVRVELAPHRISELLDEPLEHLASALEHHDLDVRVEDDVTVLVDRDAMTRVIENLLSNAVKFSPPGSTVHITGTDAGAEAGTVLLSVRDEGMGIAEGEQERVFDRFYRAPGATQPGSGIGLAIVKQYVEAQDGSVELSSVPGQGSDFTLHLRTVPAQR